MQRRQNNDQGYHNNFYGNDERMAWVLFSIVIIYLITNTPRIILNFYEFTTIDHFREDSKSFCYYLPPWVVILTSISMVLITLNSSINFFIYCVCNTSFRQQCKEYWDWFRLNLTGSSAENQQVEEAVEVLELNGVKPIAQPENSIV